MIKCINCGKLIEDGSDFCYFCGFDPNEILSKERNRLSVAQTTKRIKGYKFNWGHNYDESNFDYELHGSNPVYELIGNCGRRLYVYEHKCVLKVDVTLGSLLTHNSTDGEKTIYYKDVIGVQFKKNGFTIGYLQLETTSQKGNNANSNFFDENSFTFDNYKEVYAAYKYIISRLDVIKSI